jgi:hypothetical protein
VDASWLLPTLKSLWDAIYPEFVLALVGALIVVWQIRKQFSYALEQSRHNELLKLRLQLYQEIVPIAHAAQDAIVDLQSFIRKFDSDVSLFRQMARNARPWTVPEARVPVLLEKKNLVSEQAIAVIFFTERWEIVDARIDLFRVAVNVALDALQSTFQDYFSVVLRMMPIEVPPGNPNQGSLLPWQPPDEEGAARLAEATDIFNKAISHLSNWLHDLQVELQNLFLAELFKNKVPCRQPLDPEFIVIQLDNYERLKRYFEEETEWGRNKARIESSP